MLNEGAENKEGRWEATDQAYTREDSVIYAIRFRPFSGRESDGEKGGSVLRMRGRGRRSNRLGLVRSGSGEKMTKLAIIPCTVLLETLFFRKKFSRRIQLSLAILLLGVGIATVTDLQLNILGSILSLLAIATTCIAQIMTNTIQKRFKVSSTQLLYQSCPYQAITLFVIGPFLDGLLTEQNVFAFKYTPQVMVFIVLSCLMSVSVNFSTFLVIGKTSPVTYQVLGHLKTCLVLAFGYVLLRDPFSWRNIFGIFVAVVGMVLYSYHCTIENQQKASEVILQLSQAKESELDLLLGVENGANLSKDGVTPNSPWSSNKDLHA